MSAYCTVADVKQRMTGDSPSSALDAWTTTITDAITEVSAMIDAEVRQVRGQPDGWTFLPGSPVTRRYTGAGGGSRLLLIDDATAVTAVALVDPSGRTIQSLTSGIDYLPKPMNSLPITGLVRLYAAWPSTPGGISVSLTPGYGLTTPQDVRNATIAEVIRAIRAGESGEDDRLGMTPYGSIVVSKALLQSTVRMILRYRAGEGLLRGPD